MRIREQVRLWLGGMPCHVQVAALPWRHGENGVEVMLVTSRGTGRWVLPKGWPEGMEALCDAAAREAMEEAGIVGAVSNEALGSYFYRKQKDSGRELRCEVRVFPLEVTGQKDRWRESGQRQRRWMPVDDAARSVRERDLGELISLLPLRDARSPK